MVTLTIRCKLVLSEYRKYNDGVLANKKRRGSTVGADSTAFLLSANLRKRRQARLALAMSVAEDIPMFATAWHLLMGCLREEGGGGSAESPDKLMRQLVTSALMLGMKVYNLVKLWDLRSERIALMKREALEVMDSTASAADNDAPNRAAAADGGSALQ